jgi:LysM repeat protein
MSTKVSNNDNTSVNYSNSQSNGYQNNNPKPTYTVKKGDTLSQIAKRIGQDIPTIMKNNPNIQNPNKIFVGEKINLGSPTQGGNYTVKKGDTLTEIAKANKTSVGEIIRANPREISNKNLIYPGQKLNIPKPLPKIEDQTKPTPRPLPKVETQTKPTPKPLPKVETTKPTPKPLPKVEVPKTPTPTNPVVNKDVTLSPNIKLKNSNIQLSPLTKERMSKIADEYNRLTGKKLTITDGNRTPKDQAERIYDKIREGKADGLYKNKKLLAEIKTAYNAGVSKGESREQVTNRMAKVIQEQKNRGEYISKHLVGEGADVRINDMTAADRKAFQQAVDKVGGAKILNEGDHYHIEIIGKSNPTPVTPTPTTTIEQPKVTAPTTVTTNGNLKVANINIDEFMDPKKGSNAPFSILIGAAEGNRTPNGGKTQNYYGHKDPGDKLWNIGSFSRANARFPGQKTANSPEEADVMHLQSLQIEKTRYVNAMKSVGLDPNNALLASTYFDAANQSVRAAHKMLEPQNLRLLAQNGTSIESMKQWRYTGYINPETGQRWLNDKGKPVGGGLADIANDSALKKYGRKATEAEIQALIRRDQDRRMNEMIKTMEEMRLLSK